MSALPRGGGGAADGGDLNAQTLESFDVNGSDEAGADDSGAKVVQGDHGVCQRWMDYVGLLGRYSGWMPPANALGIRSASSGEPVERVVDNPGWEAWSWAVESKSGRGGRRFSWSVVSVLRTDN